TTNRNAVATAITTSAHRIACGTMPAGVEPLRGVASECVRACLGSWPVCYRYGAVCYSSAEYESNATRMSAITVDGYRFTPADLEVGDRRPGISAFMRIRDG